jgi:uncharacterized protein YciU (UPF0263 family)
MNNAETEGATEETVARPTARMVHPGKDVPLQFPVEFDGEVYETVHVRVCPAKEIRAYMVAAASVEDSESLVPIGADIPAEVWVALSMDDQDAISEVVDAFTPARLKEAFKRALESGEFTSQ